MLFGLRDTAQIEGVGGAGFVVALEGQPYIQDFCLHMHREIDRVGGVDPRGGILYKQGVEFTVRRYQDLCLVVLPGGVAAGVVLPGDFQCGGCRQCHRVGNRRRQVAFGKQDGRIVGGDGGRRIVDVEIGHQVGHRQIVGRLHPDAVAEEVTGVAPVRLHKSGAVPHPVLDHLLLWCGCRSSFSRPDLSELVAVNIGYHNTAGAARGA